MDNLSTCGQPGAAGVATRDDAVMTTPDPAEVHRPDLVLDALAERHPFDRPRVLLALLSGSYREQRLVDTTVLWTEPPRSEGTRARAADRAAAGLGLNGESTERRRGQILLPVVVRPGPSWWTWDETEALLALRYCPPLGNVLQAALIVVTARGWYVPEDELWGTRPRAAWTGTAAA